MKKKNTKILLLVGVPGSGKSTFAKYFLRTEENWIRLCRDDFRLMQFSQTNLSKYQENTITEIIDSSIELLLRKKTNVLIDATNCKAEYLNHYISKFNHLADIAFKVFDLDAKTIADRCEKRYNDTGKYIPNKVQVRYLKEFASLKESFDFSLRPQLEGTENIENKQDPNLPKAIICDLDGTLALMDGRNPFDAARCDEDRLNEPVAQVLKSFSREGYQILLVSGREDKFREPTQRFLEQYQIPYHELWMRKSKDSRKDSIIKREIYDALIRNKYFIEFVLDDRNQVVDMWRKDLNLNCFQVNYGNF